MDLYNPQYDSPDGNIIYGSMRDYYALMSDGEFEITGYILNPDINDDGEPDWLTMPHTKRYYHENPEYKFRDDTKGLAVSAGLIY